MTLEIADIRSARGFGRTLARLQSYLNMVEISDGALPREDSGKIFKRKLRAPYWEGQGRSI